MTEECSITVESSPISRDVSIFLLGDVNKNGSINAMDIKRLMKHIDGTNPLDITERGDINGNSAVNGMDIKRLLNHINGTKEL